MKKTIYFITTILLSAAMLSLSSCLKDKYVDFTKSAPIVNFPLGGTQYFAADAITETPDSDANGTIVRQFAVNVGSPKTLSTATNVTLAVDNSIVATYNASQTAVAYLPMPTDAFAFTATSVTIPAGKQYATVSVTFYKNKLDPSKSYMLPIKIVSAGGLNISGNQGIHYYHFIGNDFAGSWTQFYARWNSTDTTTVPLTPNTNLGTTTIFPVTPLQFEVYSAYLGGGAVRYEVTFDKTGNGASAIYSNFNVTLNSDDVKANFTGYPVASGGPITVGLQPVFLPSASATLAGPYTFAQAIKLFRFEYQVANSIGGTRTFIEQFTKP